MEKQMEYLRLLQERNRLKKMMNAKSKEESLKEQQEHGFNVHFVGAHAEKHPARNVKTKKASVSGTLKLRPVGGKGAWRKQGSSVEDIERDSVDYESDFEAASDNEIQDSELQSKMPQHSPIAENNEDVEDYLDGDLLTRIAKMNNEQKQLLLNALQNNETLSPMRSPNKKNKKKVSVVGRDQSDDTAKDATEVSAYNRGIHEVSGSFGDNLLHDTRSDFEISSNATTIAMKVVPLSGSETNAKKPAAGAAAETFEFPYRTVQLRIRVLTSWSKSKSVSLRALRLRLCTDSMALELLPSLSRKIKKGLSILPNTAPPVQGLTSLLGVDKQFGVDSSKLLKVAGGRNCIAWSAPFDLDNPLEFLFEGPLSAAAIDELNRRGSLDAACACVELLLWNAGEQGAASPAKDIDVYLEGQCIWSGELPVGDAESEGYEELHPSLAIKPFSTLRGQKQGCGSADHEISLQSTGKFATYSASPKKRRKDGKENGCSPDKPGKCALSPRKKSIERAEFSDDDLFFQRDGHQQHHQMDRSRSISEPPAPAQGKVGVEPNLDSDWLAKDLHGSIKARAGDIFDVDSNNALKVPTRKQPARRQQSNGSAGEARESSVDVNDPSPAATAPSISPQKDLKQTPSKIPTKRASKFRPPEGPPAVVGSSDATAERKNSDQQLRQSMEAVQIAEKSNLGRLSRRQAAELKAIKEAGDREKVDGDSDTSKPVAAETEQSILEKYNSLPPLEPVPTMREQLATVREVQRLSSVTRSARIGQVQEAIQSTLAGLADIMSQSNVSVKGFEKRSAMPPIDRHRAPVQLAVVEEKDVTAETEPPEKSLAEGKPAAAAIIDDVPELKLTLDDDFLFSGVPVGEKLVIKVLSTWGDLFYVGLNGIELFDDTGSLLSLRDAIQGISCIPSGVGGTPRHHTERADPRKVINLLDGVNFTRNDLHLWLTPQIGVQDDDDDPEVSAVMKSDSDNPIAIVTITLRRPVRLGMMRFYNFNKSRTHNQRGVRRCRVLLDNQLIFQGAISKASGQLTSVASESQSIYFSRDSAMVSCIDKFTAQLVHEKEENPDMLEDSINMPSARPRTAVSIHSTSKLDASHDSWHSVQPVNLDTTLLAAVDPGKKQEAAQSMLVESNNYLAMKQRHDDIEQANAVPVASNGASAADQILLLKGQVLRLEIRSTWGDANYVGLCGVEVLAGADCSPLTWLSAKHLNAYPKDLSSVGCFDDPRKLENIVNGVNNTACDANMWLIPFTRSGTHYLEINLGGVQQLAGLRVWNYNKSSDDVLRGCRNVSLSIDGKYIGRDLQLRMAPGCDGVEFGQTILFNDLLQAKDSGSAELVADVHCKPVSAAAVKYVSPAARQDYEALLNPTGSCWKFAFFDNWNDGYYVGLDRIELYDHCGKLIPVGDLGVNVAAVPYSVQDVAAAGYGAGVGQQDLRTPEQLFVALPSGAQDDDYRPCWLCPLAKCMTAEERAQAAKRIQRSNRPSNRKNSSSSEDGPVFPRFNTLFLLFPYPVTVSYIKVFNYSRTPSRGVREFSLEVDNQLVYIGTLLPADKERQKFPSRKGEAVKHNSSGQAILFTNDNKVLQQQRDLVSYCGVGDQDVLCINERQIMVRSRGMYDNQPNVALEGVHSDLAKRPMTSYRG